MKIVLSPQRRDDVVVYEKLGDVIIVNNESFDFSRMMDGDTLPGVAIKSEWFAGDVTKEDGELTLTLILPNPWNYSQEQAFPLPLIDVQDGPLEGVLPKPLPETFTVENFNE